MQNLQRAFPQAFETNIDELVHDLGRLYQEAGIRLAMEMGKLIIERLYGGDLVKWRSRGRKDVSFRKLERHPDLPFRASTLSRAVSIYMLCRRRADLLEWRHIRPSHLHEIAGLPEGLQDTLLARAETERWSVQTLRREVGSLVGRRRNRLRTVAPAFARCLRAMETEIEGRRLLADIELVDRLSPDEARHLLDSLKALLQQGAILAKGLSDRIREVPTTPPPRNVVPHPIAPGPSSAHLRALQQAVRPS